jgi:hypothetical protein
MKLSFITVTTIACLLLAAAGIARADNPFIVFHPYAMEELKLSDDQKQKLREKLPNYQVDGRFSSQKVDAVAHEQLWAFLKETLNEKQFTRFQQLELQHEPAVIIRPEIVKKLQITDKQREQIMGLIQDLKKKNEAGKKASQSGGNPPQETRLKGMRAKMREDYDGKVEAILNDAQKAQWNEMRGKLFDIP